MNCDPALLSRTNAGLQVLAYCISALGLSSAMTSARGDRDDFGPFQFATSVHRGARPDNYD
mgnify:CR=1 FL=1|jgi:hypothetical protein